MRAYSSLFALSFLLTVALASPWRFHLRAAAPAVTPEVLPPKERRQLAVPYSNFSLPQAPPARTPPATGPQSAVVDAPYPPIFASPTSCSTTLYPLAQSPISITDCQQTVTYSTDHGYRLVGTTNSIENLTTYWEARWDGLKLGVMPSAGATKVCSQAGCGDAIPTATASTISTSAASGTYSEVDWPMVTPADGLQTGDNTETISSLIISTSTLTSTRTNTITLYPASSTPDSPSPIIMSLSLMPDLSETSMTSSSVVSSTSAKSNLDLGLGLGLG